MIYRIYAGGEFLMNLYGWPWEVNDRLAEIRECFVCEVGTSTVDLL
jgi:hypothetical protein